MSSNLPGKCPLCLKPVLIRSFKRHCNSFHTSIDTDQKLQKQICKLKENIIKNNNNENILRQTATNDLPIQRSTSNEFSPPPSKRVRRESANEIENISSIYGNESILNTADNKKILNCSESVDPNISTKHFVIETSTYLTALRESITDLLIKCDQTLEQIPSSLLTTTEMIKSSEISISRDPSTRKIHNEVELRYLVNEGPYQPILKHYPDNEVLKKNNQTCHFTSKWYQEFPLIEYSPTKDSIYCF
ncbi:unnamed protein product, partial [Didymodactylos carnosus]